jgi:hypothetical protein
MLRIIKKISEVVIGFTLAPASLNFLKVMLLAQVCNLFPYRSHIILL